MVWASMRCRDSVAESTGHEVRAGCGVRSDKCILGIIPSFLSSFHLDFLQILLLQANLSCFPLTLTSSITS